MLSRGLQQVHRADGVDVEIVERAAGRQVVAGLGGAVDDQVEWTFGPEEPGKPGAVADIQVVVAKMTRRFPQPLQVPPRVPFRTEEVGPHVVVDADDALRAAVEEADKLRTDQATGTCDKYFHGRSPIFSVYSLACTGERNELDPINRLSGEDEAFASE